MEGQQRRGDKPTCNTQCEISNRAGEFKPVKPHRGADIQYLPSLMMEYKAVLLEEKL